MTAYRFRVKLEPDPRSLWRDIVVGEERPLTEFQTSINRTVGLDQSHLWFIGTDQDYWRSDVRYESPDAFEDMPSSGLLQPNEEVYDAGEATVGEMAQRLGLEERDRFCYLFDYGDEWRFYAILKELLDDEPSDTQPEVVAEKGDPVDQYAPSDYR
nr:hypothetical protein [Halorussus sp. DT80]